MNILHVLYQQLRSKLCFILYLYFYTFVYDFHATYINDGATQVTHFSSTLIFRIDILTMRYFFTSFYLMMILQNNPLVPTREFLLNPS